MAGGNLARVARLKAMRQEINSRLKPGDIVERIKGREDVFLGLFEFPGSSFAFRGWYGMFEFTEARGYRTKSRVEMPTILRMLGVDLGVHVPGKRRIVGLP
jgi:hypothetical protein